MSCIHTTDFHLRESQPKNRITNITDDQITNIQGVCDYVDANKGIDIWFDTGDFFHTVLQKSRLVNRIMSVFKNMKRQDIFPIICVHGNHLEKGNFKLSVEGSGLRTLELAGYVKIMPDPCLYEHNGKKILLHHHNITEKRVIWDHITYEEVIEKWDPDYVLCSHDHTPRPPKTIGKCTFIAPGSLTRGVGKEANLDRTPQFAHFDLKGKKKVKYVDAAEYTYPFHDKSISVDVLSESKALAGDIVKKLEGYEISSLNFHDVRDLLVKDDVFNETVADYLTKIYEKTIS